MVGCRLSAGSHRGESAAGPGRRRVRHLGQRGARRQLQPRHTEVSRQSEGYRRGLVRVEEQRGQLGPAPQCVAAVATGVAVDSVTDPAQVLDIPACGALGDTQALRQGDGSDSRPRLYGRQDVQPALGGRHNLSIVCPMRSRTDRVWV